jgi:hypothetical protein
LPLHNKSLEAESESSQEALFTSIKFDFSTSFWCNGVWMYYAWLVTQRLEIERLRVNPQPSTAHVDEDTDRRSLLLFFLFILQFHAQQDKRMTGR